MKDAIEKIRKWNKTASVPEREEPGFPSQNRVYLRIDMLDEELDELEKAVRAGDIVEVFDALCDIQYVLLGAVTDFGLQDVFEEGFNEVYRSNMSKFVENTHDASESVNRLLDKGVESNYKKVGDLFVIRRNEDDKILKGMYFTPPNLKKIINSKFGKK